MNNENGNEYMFMGFEMNTIMEVLLVCVEQGSTNTCILNFQHMGLRELEIAIYGSLYTKHFVCWISCL